MRTSILAAVFLVTLISRVPFLDAGYGWDEDAWGNAVNASRIASSGEYSSSRPPGFPIPDVAFALTWHRGPFWMNGLSAFFGALASALFAALLLAMGAGLPVAALGGLALGFTPLVYISSTVCMDYAWGLAFLLGATLAAWRGRPVFAGLLLGVAAGCRLSALLMLVPLCLLALRERGAWKRGSFAARLALFAVLAACVFYAPVWRRYGFGFLTFSDQPFSVFAAVVRRNLTAGIWGSVGLLAWSIGLVTVLLLPGRSLAGAALAQRRMVLAVSLSAILVYVILFLRLPAEASYLLPAVPFLLAAAAALLHRTVFVALCVALVGSPWIDLPYDPEDFSRWDPATQDGGSASPGSTNTTIAGPVLYQHRLRLRQMRSLRDAFAVMERLPGGPLVVVAAAYYNQVAGVAPLIRQLENVRGDVTILRGLEPEEVRRRTLGGDMVYTVRGYRNCVALGYGVVPGPDGSWTLVVNVFPTARPGGLPRPEDPTPLDMALIGAAIDPGAMERFVALLQETAFLVPFMDDGRTPLVMKYRGRRSVAVFDTELRTQALGSWRKRVRWASVPGSDLGRFLRDDTDLILNYGVPSERVISSDEWRDVFEWNFPGGRL